MLILEEKTGPCDSRAERPKVAATFPGLCWVCYKSAPGWRHVYDLP